MRKALWLILCVFLLSCSVSHKLKINKQPCLYPWKKFDFTLCQNFKFSINGFNYTIPRGFTTDLASVPRVLWSIYSPNRTETIAGAVIHDYFYFCPSNMTRAEADSILYDALIYQGISKQMAFKYWLAVRTFGAKHFHQGAICTHVYIGTKNTSGHFRMAHYAASASG